MARQNDWTLEHLSQLMLGKFMTCRQQYAYRYIQRLPEPKGLWAPSGQTVHKALYDFHQHPKMHIDEIMALAEAYWDEESDGVEYYNFKGERETADDVENTKQDTFRWIEQYINAVRDGDFPCIVFDGPPERDEEFPIEGTTHIARGYIDAFVKNIINLQTGKMIDACDDGRIHILDFKCASKKFNAWNQAKADSELQPTVYGYIMGKKAITMHYIVVEKTASHQKPSLKHITTHRDAADYTQYEKMVKMFEINSDRVNKHELGLFYPEPEFGWGRFCGKMCSYKDTCYKENFAHRDSST
tara:strand:- start:864 stop:1763 length:900 start_codon:yes stop_codon:yes gene_type:complete